MARPGTAVVARAAVPRVAAGTGGQGGAAGSMDGAAGQAGGSNVVTAKFCNPVGFGEEGNPMPITLRLDIGTAPNIVSFSALTDTCTPIDNMPCTEIPKLGHRHSESLWSIRPPARIRSPWRR